MEVIGGDELVVDHEVEIQAQPEVAASTSGYGLLKFKRIVKPALFRPVEDNPLVAEIVNEDPSLKESAFEVLNSVLAGSTQRNYNYVWKQFVAFGAKNGKNLNENGLDEKILIKYLLHKNKEKSGLSFYSKIIPAIKLECDIRGWSSDVLKSDMLLRIVEGCKRKAATRRSPIKKAAPLSLQVIKMLVSKYVVPHQTDASKIQAAAFRSIFRAMIQYHTMCRWDCFKHLRAKHFVLIDGNIEVTFPQAKNDQYHAGNTTFLVASSSEFCPVQITRIYFKRFGLKMDGKDDSYVNFQLRKKEGHIYADARCSLGYTTAVENLRKLLRVNGFEDKGISEKSAKIAGVTETMEAGASAEEVMWLGRWKTTSMPNHYKHNSDEFKIGLAKKVQN